MRRGEAAQISAHADDRNDPEPTHLVVAFGGNIQRVAPCDGPFRRPAAIDLHAVVLAVEIDEVDIPIVAGGFFGFGGHKYIPSRSAR